MFRNYLLVMLRNAWRKKGYSFINVFGLALGIAASMMILMFVRYELSFDRSFSDSGDLYRVNIHTSMPGSASYIAFSPPALVPHSKTTVASIKSSARVWELGRVPIKFNEQELESEFSCFVDSSFFQVLDFPLKYGDPSTALTKPYSVVLDEELSRKLFGDENPVGKMIVMFQDQPYTVTGVLEPSKSPTHLHSQAFLSLNAENQNSDEWARVNALSYLRLEPGSDVKAVEKACQDLFEEAMGETLRSYGMMWTIELFPVTRIHLYSNILGDPDTNISSTYVFGFAIVAVFILLLACINFVNLSIAKSAQRAREVGMRKVLGAQRVNLIWQLIGESLLYAFVAMLVAVVIISLALPWFRAVSDRPIELGHLFTPAMLLAFLSIFVIVGVASGFFPALYLSSFQPIATLKGTALGRGGGNGIRRVLVVGQFVVSIALILGTMTVFRQIQYLRHMDLGWDQEQVVSMYVNVPEDDQRIPILERLRNQYLTLPGVSSACLTGSIPIAGNIRGTFLRPEGFPDDQPFRAWVMVVDGNFLKTFGIKMLEGRDFDDNSVSDNGEALILNETAVKDLNWTGEALGKEIPMPIGMLDPNSEIRKKSEAEETDEAYPSRVVGVVKDFTFVNLRNRIEATVIVENRSAYNAVSLRVTSKLDRPLLDKIESIWTAELPEQKFNPIFLDDVVARMVDNDRRFGTILEAFTLLAIVIAALGLFGLATHAAERRTKELGVRKVLGANEMGLIVLLTKEYTWMVVIASLLGIPLAWYFINKWLEGFAYRTHVDVWVALGTLISALFIAWLSVGWQALRASRRNPVDSLRYE